MHLDSLVAPLVEQASAILDAATALFSSVIAPIQRSARRVTTSPPKSI